MIKLNGYFMDKCIKVELKDADQCSFFILLCENQLNIISAMGCPSSCKYKSVFDGDCHALIVLGDSLLWLRHVLLEIRY